ncbi:MAG: FoF1 ATP synthase subunit A [Mycoplasmoidaceae bacterium]
MNSSYNSRTKDPNDILNPNNWHDLGSAGSFIFSIAIVTLLIFVIFYYYKRSLTKLNSGLAPGGLALILFVIINYFKNITRDLLGESLEKFTPVILGMFFYILISNFLSLVALDPPTSSITVTVSLGMFTWIGTQVMGIKFQKFEYLKRMCFNIKIKSKESNKEMKIPYMVNPLEVIGLFTPLISISFRLWGNIFAGGLILMIVYNISDMNGLPNIINGTSFASDLVIISGFFAPPIHLFLDVMVGAIQAYVFIILTLVYWNIAKIEI